MRLIDADELRPDIRLKDGTLCFSKSRIANAPTVEARPKGEWICVRWMQYKCSECDYYYIGTATNYCPNCGARMEINV